MDKHKIKNFGHYNLTNKKIKPSYNKKGFFQVGNFIIIVIAIGFVILIGSYLFTGLTKTMSSTSYGTMVTDIKTTVDSMSNENSGVTEIITIKPPKNIIKLCFVDYNYSGDTNPPITTELRMQNIAGEIYTSYQAGDSTQPNNLFIFTEKDFEMMYIGDIAVEEIHNGAYCIDSKPRIKLIIQSKGKKVLIKENSGELTT